jgi:hypothetical protein
MKDRAGEEGKWGMRDRAGEGGKWGIRIGKDREEGELHQQRDLYSISSIWRIPYYHNLV